MGEHLWPQCLPAVPFIALVLWPLPQWRATAAHKASQRDKVAACLGRMLHRQQAAAVLQWRGYVQYRRADGGAVLLSAKPSRRISSTHQP